MIIKYCMKIIFNKKYNLKEKNGKNDDDTSVVSKQLHTNRYTVKHLNFIVFEDVPKVKSSVPLGSQSSSNEVFS